MSLRIPSCATPGEYKVQVRATWDDDHESAVGEATIRVAEGDLCQADSVSEAVDKTVITVSAETQSVGKNSEVVYPITISNVGTSTKTYVIGVAAGEWANVRISPSNVIVAKSGETKVVSVFVSAKADTLAGAKALVLSIKSGDETVKELVLSAKIDESAAAGNSNSVVSSVSLKKSLEIGLVVLVVLLVIIGLVIGFNKIRGSEEEPKDEEGQTYY